MIKIEQQGNDYKINFSNPGSGWHGFSTLARSFAEVHIALDHYAGQVDHINRPADNCPLCRDTAARVWRGLRRKAERDRRGGGEMEYQVYYYEDAVPGHAQPESLGSFRTEREAKAAAREVLGCGRLIGIGDDKYAAPGTDEFSAYVEIELKD